jgi:hypothetical protein
MSTARYIAFLLAVTVATARAQHDGVPPEITRDTARVNAAVRAARVTYREVQARLAARAYAYLEEDCEAGDGATNDFQTWRDSSGTVRKLRLVLDDRDAIVHYEFFYDPLQRLRFTLVIVDGVGEQSSEARYYYDDGGVLVRKVDTITRGTHDFPQPERRALDPVQYVREACEKE